MLFGYVKVILLNFIFFLIFVFLIFCLGFFIIGFLFNNFWILLVEICVLGYIINIIENNIIENIVWNK